MFFRELFEFLPWFEGTILQEKEKQVLRFSFQQLKLEVVCSYYGETDRHLKVESGEHIGISPLTFKKVKPSAESSIHDHLLFCNHDPSFDNFTILAQRTNKFLLEIKESLLIKRDKPILNKNISSAPLFLFDKV